ncbi:bifunctional diguanylate cyclase/phosphodiesterase [Magnetospirillum gryphiswaldense]|uniref:bifunctional diguanylate cyclase/phosphodiesterase n=1 Tax=Magnetospirillum gryphiswaldense TaxID=55518 RepID=UPI001319D984|nr:EAL domain-containing protein [Magnetospirillum gryphiswaldense]
MAILIAAFLLPAVIGISYFVGSRSVSQMQADKGMLLSEAAIQLAAHMDTGLYERWREIQVFAGMAEIVDPKAPLARKKQLLETLKNSYPNYAWIGFTDTEGNILAGTGGMLEGKSVAQRSWFQEGKKGPFLGDVHDAFLLAKLIPRDPKDPLPLRLLDVSAPLISADGVFLGVLCGHLSWDWSREIKAQSLAPLQQRNLTGVHILNHEGKTVLGTGDVASWPDVSNVPSVASAKQGMHGWTIENWPDGKSYLTGYARAKGTMGSPGLGWIILIHQPVDEAFADAVLFRNQVMIVGFLVAVGAAAWLWLALGRTIRPLTRIAEIADRIQKGEAVAQIPIIDGRSEAHILSVSLNRLVSTLADRNADLAAANTALEDDIRRREALEQELRLAATYYEASAEGIVVTVADGTIASVNDAFCRITGYQRHEVLGKTTSLLKSGVQDDEFYADMWQLLRDTGHWEGEIWNRRKDGRTFPEYLTINAVRRDGEITHYVAQFSDLSDRKAAEEKIVQLSTHDTLTGLPKRIVAMERLSGLISEARRDGRLVALIYVNLDGLNRVNDALGHHGGDRVLVETAQRLRQLLQPADALARLGGDEFLIISSRFMVMAEAEALARQILDACSQAFFVDEKDTYLTARIGIAFYPRDGEDPLELIRNSHAASVRAKEQGGNIYRIFTRDMDDEAVARHALDAELRQAMNSDDQFKVFYQPLVNAQSGRIIGAEALVRWFNPTRGLVPPDRFIPLAESNGLIVPMGRKILATACADGARFRKHIGSDFFMAVNVAAAQCADPGFLETVSKCLSDAKLPPHCLEVEITERTVVGNNPTITAFMTALREAESKLSIDDFGTGYSALSYLRQYPFTTLKIDRSFVMGIGDVEQDDALVLAIIHMAHALGLEVIAEGVETTEQQEFLRDAGCETLQGYLLGKPMPADEFMALVQKA